MQAKKVVLNVNQEIADFLLTEMDKRLRESHLPLEVAEKLNVVFKGLASKDHPTMKSRRAPRLQEV